MRRNVLALLLIGTAFGISSEKATACGDKYLVVGRGARLQRAYCAVHPAAILVYVNPRSERAAAMGDPQFTKALTLAGHKTQALTDLSKVSGLVDSTRFDIVLVDFADAAAMERQLASASTKPSLLPILYKPSDAVMSAAMKQFGTVLKAPDRITHFLNIIDDVMKARRDAGKL